MRFVVSCLVMLVMLPAFAAPAVTPRLVADTLDRPVNLAHAGDGSGRLFVVERPGIIRVIDAGGTLQTAPFLDISDLGLVGMDGERGMLGLAFHPLYAANGAFYVFYTHAADGALTVARYLRDPMDANRALPGSAAVILTIPHADDVHNGGHLAFGPDGFLYIATGDGGGGGDPAGNGQNLGVLLGKLLRIAVDGGTGYTIPAGNPFAMQTCAGGACPEIWAYGLRNPWKFSFDRATGDLFISDVGQDEYEEIDYQPAGAGGRNYGWGVFEGLSCYNDNYFGPPNACANLAGHVPPIIVYDHGPAGGFSVTGGVRYRGTRIPALQGYYVYADFFSRRMWGARPDMMGTWVPEVLIEPGPPLGFIAAIGEDEAGELYVVDFSNGRLYTLDPTVFALTAVQSRKTHGAAGSFDRQVFTGIPVTGPVTIEPRDGIGGHLIVFQFNSAVTAQGTVAVTDAAGAPQGSATLSSAGSEVRVRITGLPVIGRALVSLTGVEGAGSTLNAAAAFGFLPGDVSSSRRVNAVDVSAVKARLGEVLGFGTLSARFDLDLSGEVDAADVALAKSRSGTLLP